MVRVFALFNSSFFFPIEVSGSVPQLSYWRLDPGIFGELVPSANRTSSFRPTRTYPPLAKLGVAFSFTFHDLCDTGVVHQKGHITIPPQSTTTIIPPSYTLVPATLLVCGDAKSFALLKSAPFTAFKSDALCNGRNSGCLLAGAAVGKVSVITISVILDVNGSNKAPHRTFAATVLLTSICVHFGILPYTWFYFHYLEIFKIPPQIWRFFTSFLITGPKLGIVMDTYFIYQYTSQLETAHPKFNRKEDLLWYMVFCSLVIIVSLTTTVACILMPFSICSTL